LTSALIKDLYFDDDDDDDDDDDGGKERCMQDFGRET
jgi:hypothetical protein